MTSRPRSHDQVCALDQHETGDEDSNEKADHSGEKA
jgi:hypothetical protein